MQPTSDPLKTLAVDRALDEHAALESGLDPAEETPARRVNYVLERLGYCIDPAELPELDRAEPTPITFDATLYATGPLSVERLDPRRLGHHETIIAWLEAGGHDHGPREVAYYRHRAALRRREIALATGKLYEVKLPEEATALPAEQIHCYMAELAECEELPETAEKLALAAELTTDPAQAEAIEWITSRVDWQGMRKDIDRRRTNCGLAPVYDLQAVRDRPRASARARQSHGSASRRRGSRRSSGGSGGGGSGGGGSGDDDAGEPEPARGRLREFPREVAL